MATQSRGALVNFDNEWELSKENVQPLKHGRNVAELNQVLHEQNKDILLEKMKARQQALPTSPGDNPIEALNLWFSHLKWVEQNFPTGNSNTLKLALGTCITTFGREPSIFNTNEWLYIWQKFANCSESMGSIAIYEQMHELAYCTLIPKFYIQWAWELEQAGNLKRASEVLALGLTKPQMQPEARRELQEAQSVFDMRVGRRLAATEPSEHADDEQTRNVFGKLRGIKVGKHMQTPYNRENTGSPGAVAHSASRGASQKQPFSVFEGTSSDKNAIPLVANVAQQLQLAEQNLNKENVRSPAQWPAQKLSSAASSRKDVANANPNQISSHGFNVFCDTGESSAQRPIAPPSTKEPNKQSHSGSSRLSGMRTSTAGAKTTTIVAEKLMYWKDKFCPDKGPELQFEEARAQRWFEREKAKRAASTMQLRDLDRGLDGDFRVNGLMLNQDQLTHCTAKPIPFASRENPTAAVSQTAAARRQVFGEIGTSTVSASASQPARVRQAFGDTGAALPSTSTLPITTAKLVLAPQQDRPVSSLRDVAEPKPSKLPAFMADIKPVEEGTLTRAIRKDALAAFSSSLNFTSWNEEPFGIASDSIIESAPPAVQTNHEPFTVFDENACAAAAKPAFAVFEDVDDDKENRQPSNYVQQMEQRPISGVLQPSIGIPTAPLDDWMNNVDVVRDPFSPPVASNASHLDFDPLEPTLAGLGKFAQERGGIVVSTPFHSQFLPPSFTNHCSKDSKSGKQLTNVVMQASELTEHVSGVELVASTSKASVTHIAESTAQLSDVHVYHEALAPVERRLSAIVETSRECYSSSSGSSDASSRRRCNSVNSTVHSQKMNQIGEQWWQTQTPGSDASHWSTKSGSAFPGAGVSLGLSMGKSHTKPFSAVTRVDGADTDLGNAVRRLSLDEHQPPTSAAATTKLALNECSFVKAATTIEHEDVDQHVERTGYGLRAQITSNIDPFDPDTQAQLLVMAKKNLNNYTNFHLFRDHMPAVRVKRTIDLGGETYAVTQLLGEGAFARAYQAMSYDDDGDASWCLKVQKPPCPWEFYICEELRRRIRSLRAPLDVVCESDPGVMLIRDGYFFEDGSIMVSRFFAHGTLLDVVNAHKRQQITSLHEMLVVFLLIEILRIIEALHAVRIIHGDLKPDNFLFKKAPPTYDAMADLQDPEVVFGHSVRCVHLIDFGRSIDMHLMPPGTQFRGCVETDGFQCPEMLDGREWSYQPDMFGVAATTHVMLFFDYMKIYCNNKWRMSSSIKRKWNTELWKEFFDSFLNIPSSWELPNLSVWRGRFEQFFLDWLCLHVEEWNAEVDKLARLLFSCKSAGHS